VDLRQRLQLIVDATTGKADAEFRKLTGSTRELGTTAEKSAGQVRAAADRVADARELERIAAGQRQVAERRLQELRDSGRARASQLLAAEEKAAAAQRTLQRAVHGTSRALQEQQEATRGAPVELENAQRSGGLLAGVSDRAKAGLAGLAGAGIGAGLRGVADQFAAGARAAGQFATSTNSSVEQAGAFLGLVSTLGLELNDLLEIQAEYAQKAAASSGELEALGAQLVRNQDGTVNWTESLVSFLDQLQQVPDATERNRLGFQFLGEEGYKQLSRLVSSGVDVREALERIGTPFSPEDIQMAADYDAAMMDLSLTGQRTSQTLGRVLVPVATQVLDAFGDVVGVLEDMGPVLVTATALAITMGVTGFSPTAVAGARLATVTALVNRNLALYRVAAATGTRSSMALAGGMTAASAAGRGLMGLAGGPLGVALIALSVVYTLASDGAEKFRESAREAAVELEQSREKYGDMAMSVEELGQRLAEEAGFWDGLAASRRGVDQLDMPGPDWIYDATGQSGLLALGDQLSEGELAAAGFADEIENARQEVGEFGLQQEAASTATRSLNDLIAQGITEGSEFAEAVGNAADAQAAQERTSGLAAAAIDAYNAVTRDAVESTLNLWNAQLQQRDGLRGLRGAIKDAAETVQDSETPWNDVAAAIDDVIGAALDYASTSSDAAVAAARASGEVVDAQREAAIRGQETLRALYETLQQPGITAGARSQVQDLIGDLKAAQESGDVEAVLRLTGAAEATGELDEATQDRDTTVRVESRNGPAVKSYLDGLAKQRLALIRTESRNGPAVREYLDSLTTQRLALIRVETRNGPAVDRYLDELASNAGAGRTAWIDVRERGAGAGGGGAGPTGAAMLRGAPSTSGMYGGGGGLTIQQLQMIVQADATGRVTAQSLAEAGRQAVRAIGEYERRNGTGWRQGGRR
jgi:hypothetical protein